MLPEVLGVDIGGVVSDGDTDEVSGMIFGDHYLETPTMIGAVKLLAELNGSGGRFEGRVWLVSKCGDRIQGRTTDWLVAIGFHATTGIPPERVRFCRDRAGKAPICAELGVTHFIDDRLETLGYLAATVPNRYLFRGRDNEVAKHVAHLPGVVRVRSWAHLGIELLTGGIR